MKKSKKQEKKVTPVESENGQILRDKITIGFASMIEVLFLLLELYFIIHAYGNFQVMIIIAICMAVILFFLVMSSLNLNQRIKGREREEIEEMYRAQKATYIATKKYFDELGERIDALEVNTNFPADDVISAQKAVAKVTINRNKENADAVLNSNDEIVRTMRSLQEQLASNNAEMLRQQTQLMDAKLGENNETLQQQFDVLSHMMASLQNDLAALEQKTMNMQVTPGVSSVETMNVGAQAMFDSASRIEGAVPPQSEPVANTQVVPEVEEVVVPDLGFFADATPEAATIEPEPVAIEEDYVDNIQEIEIPDDLLGNLGMEMPEEPSADVQEIEIPDDSLAGLDMEMPVDAFAGAGEVEIPADALGDIQQIEFPADSFDEIQEIDIPDDILQMDDLPDLDALLAEVDVSSATEESAADEPIKVEPLPDLGGDPNRALTPEEIAALFASV